MCFLKQDKQLNGSGHRMEGREEGGEPDITQFYTLAL